MAIFRHIFMMHDVAWWSSCSIISPHITSSKPACDNASDATAADDYDDDDDASDDEEECKEWFTSILQVYYKVCIKRGVITVV